MKKIAILMIALILSLTVLPCYAAGDGSIELPPVPLNPSDTIPEDTLTESPATDGDTPVSGGVDISADAEQGSVTVADVIVDEDGNVTLIMSDGTMVNVGTVSTEENPEEKPEVSNTFMFEPTNFVGNLYYMGVGMVGIFIVIGIIVLATVLLNKIFSDKSKKAE